MPVPIKDVITFYNDKFEQTELSLRIIEWDNTKIKLNTGVVLEGDEKRKFRTRAKSKTTLPHLDQVYGIDDKNERNIRIRGIQAANASSTNKEWWDSLPATEKSNRIEHMRQIQKLSPPYKERRPRVHWNKGKTKNNDARLQTISEQRKGKGNPMYGKRMSEDEKQRKSKLIKDRILSGEWTPHIHNSRTHWQCSYNGQKYRSSWEAMYAYLNPHDEYEKVRIQYKINDERKIYIVDFVNHSAKTLTEVKPKSHLRDEVFLRKYSAARKWCEDHGYNYRVLNEQYFVDNYHQIDFNVLHIPNFREKLSRIKRGAE